MLSKSHSFLCEPVNIRGSREKKKKEYTKMIIWKWAQWDQGTQGKNYQENQVETYCMQIIKTTVVSQF